MLTVLAVLFLSQAPLGGDPTGGQMPRITDEQRCQMECGRKMLECQEPCAPKSSNDANDPAFRKQFATCARQCATKNKPCIDACADKKPKGQKDKKK